MADEDVVEEMLMNVPLRNAKAVSKTRRADTAVSVLKEYVSRHSKTPVEDVWVDPKVNEYLWNRGRKNVVSKVSVKVIKLQDGKAEVIFP